MSDVLHGLTTMWQMVNLTSSSIRVGWEKPAELPQWKQFEIQQQQAQDEAIPNMVNLDDIL